MDPDIINLAQNLGILATGVAAIVAGWRFAVVPTFNFFKKIKEAYDIIISMSEQFSTNGGSSMRDAINRIEARQIIQEQRQKLLAMDAPFAILETNSEGNFIDVNRTFCRWVGRSTEELLGKGWINSLSPAWRELVFDEWESSISQQREFSMKFRIVDIDGDTIPVFSTAFPLYDSKKILVGWVGMMYKTDHKEVPDDPDQDETIPKAIERIKSKRS